VLLTAQRIEKVSGEDVPLTAGYVIVDVAARTARFVPTGDGAEVKQAAQASDGRVKPLEHHAEYRWTPDGRSVISSFLTAQWGQGVRIRDADSGRATRMMHWTGEVQGVADWFSPSGDKFVTGGCAKTLSACVWKTADASRLHTVPLLKGAGFFGWYDENHLIVAASVEKGRRGVFVTDMSGKPVRVLAMVKAPDDVVVDVRYTRG
jgi:WD40 repeat protein